MAFSDLFAALGLALVLEGVAYALFPDAMRRMMARILELATAHIRTVGLMSAAFGLVVIWLARS